MNAAIESLLQQHKDCDAHLSACESALLGGRLVEAKERYAAFNKELEAHLSLEENQLFPAFEKATGIVAGPTEVMRQEHEDLRLLLEQLGTAIESDKSREALDVIDTMNVMIAQHNVKEENVLYPMCANSIPDLDQILATGD
jgi:iron-sulfur cluster repair protein YtfE (RIC family)